MDELQNATTELLSNSVYPPYEHQVVGIQKIVDSPYTFITDEMGSGKTKQVIDAVQVLFERDLYDKAIVLCPAAVRGVWADHELGEIAKHRWPSTSIHVTVMHSKMRQWALRGESRAFLSWFVCNYEWIGHGYKGRKKEDEWRNIDELLQIADKRTILIVDESSAVKSMKAKRTKATEILRRKCGKVVLLNGTPIANNPGDLYAQARLLHPSILGCDNEWMFRNRYAVLGGWQRKQIVGWRDLEDLQKRLAPYTLRRLKEDCLDLPPKIGPIHLTVPLGTVSWNLYRNMRDELIAELSDGSISTGQQAAVKVLRLQQITSGFLGGRETLEGKKIAEVQIIGSEKHDLLMDWAALLLEQSPNAKLMVWCRYRKEVERIEEAFRGMFVHTGKIYGAQTPNEREQALRLLNPRTVPLESVGMVGTVQTGAMGIDLTGSHTVPYFSQGDSLMHYLQSMDRTHRTGQHHPVTYYNLLATGPKGEKTIDHTKIKALQKKLDIASWTVNGWRDALVAEKQGDDDV